VSVLIVFADNLGPGSLPVYSVPKDWPFPVLSVSRDGNTILRLRPSGDRVFLETFEISGTEEEIKDRIGLVLTRLITTAGFAGRATVAVRTDYFTLVEGRPLHVLEIGVMFTADFDEEPETEVVQWNAPASWRPRGFPEVEAVADQLLDGLVIAEVMLS